jgi:hypothetical protein
MLQRCATLSLLLRSWRAAWTREDRESYDNAIPRMGFW